MDVLDKIAKLRAALTAEATLDQTSGWWRMYQSIQNDLEFNRRTSKYEHAKLQEVKVGLSTATRMIREGLPSPDTLSAAVALSALQNSIERRTIGPDGEPLRK